MKISACMIVKNEQEMLPRCLESIKDICDEIIVVDTGSEDRTVEIAESYGAKIYHHPWQNDFSLHRNQSLGYATGDWFFVIDADEELGPMEVSVEQFRDRLRALPEVVTALAVNVHERRNGHNEMTWPGTRFFRKSANLRYENIIHNKPKIDGQSVLTNIDLYHHGYSLSPEQMAAKYERTYKLLMKRIEEDPDDYNTLYYLCQNSMSRKEYEDGVKYGRRCLDNFPYQHEPEQLGYYGTIYYTVGMANIKLDQPNEAHAWLDKGLQLFPNDIDINFAMALVGFLTQVYDIFLPAAKRYLEEVELHHKPFKMKGFVGAVGIDDVAPRNLHHIDAQSQQDMEQWLMAMEATFS